MYMTKPKQVKKKTLRKYRENFFRNYAPFYIQRGGIITIITVYVLYIIPTTTGQGAIKPIYIILPSTLTSQVDGHLHILFAKLNLNKAKLV